jgi:hypothetical protein
VKKNRKFEFINDNNIIILVKKPKNGGTPAIENKDIVTEISKKKLSFKSLKENKTLKFKLTNCCKTQKIIISDML